MWRSCRKKTAMPGEAVGQPLQEACSAAGCLPLPEVLQGGPQHNRELPLILQPGGGWRHIARNGHWTLCLAKEQARCYGEGFFPVSEACWVHLLLDGGAWEVVFFLPCHGFFGRVPGRNCSVGVQAAGSISVYKSRGAFVQSYLPPCKGSLLIQWEPNRLHLFCLSLKHSFLVLTGNNLAGISNWNELFNFYIDDLSCSQAGDLPYILQIDQVKSWCFYKVLLRPNLFIFLMYFSFTQNTDFSTMPHRVPGYSLCWKNWDFIQWERVELVSKGTDLENPVLEKCLAASVVKCNAIWAKSTTCKVTSLTSIMLRAANMPLCPSGDPAGAKESPPEYSWLGQLRRGSNTTEHHVCLESLRRIRPLPLRKYLALELNWGKIRVETYCCWVQ